MRTILHSDFNNFYASVECLFDPSLVGRPVIVAGDEEARHGCPEAAFVPARYDRYLRYSALAREIYVTYTDQVEPFGLDECWLDVSGSRSLFGDGRTIADDLRARIRRELGLTVSVGVSFNKVFAKLGSDMQKPDATTVIGPEDYREKTWGLPVSDLLYIGPATTKKLARYGVRTIGDLARYDPRLLRHSFGKVGVMLWAFANGRDTSGVSPYYAAPPVKTVGNSTTAPRDLKTDDDVKITLYALGESVAARLRAQRSMCATVQLGVRDTSLTWYERQAKLLRPSCSASEIVGAAWALFRANRPEKPVRSLSLRAAGLSVEDEAPQLSLFPEDNRAQRHADLERAVDRIRGKYGYTSIRRGLTLLDPRLDLDAQRDHVVHPIGFLGSLNQ